MGRAWLGEDALREVTLGLAEATDLETLADRVVPAFASALGSSLAFLHRDHEARVEGGPAPAWTHAVRAYEPYRASCPLQAVKGTMSSGVRVITDDLDARALRSSPVFRDCFAAFDCERQLIANLGHVRPGRPGSTIILIARSRRQRAFDGSDVALVRSFVPALAAAITRNDRLAALHAVADEGRAAQIVFDEAGRVLWQSRTAAELLGGSVPEVLTSAARRLAAAAAPAPLEVRLRGERSALLRRATASTGAPVIVAALDTGQPLSLAEAARRFRLTRAESAVLDALARGYANAEIAEHLRITRGTARIHLSRIYAKLGVTSRTQALVKVRR